MTADRTRRGVLLGGEASQCLRSGDGLARPR